MAMKNPILIIGATSSIARAAAKLWAERGHDLYLTGRSAEELHRLATDLAIRFEVAVRYKVLLIEDYSHHEDLLASIISDMGSVAGVLLASGYLGDHPKAISDFTEAKKILEINFLGACSVLIHCANALAAQQSGFIAALGSVAGDRGRQSNFVYGSAKAGLDVFLQGLRNRMFSVGVQVLTVKPGFTDTAMTYGKPGLFLVASPQEVALAIVKALDKRKNILYVPSFWRYVMALIKAIPESLFKRLKL